MSAWSLYYYSIILVLMMTALMMVMVLMIIMSVSPICSLCSEAVTSAKWQPHHLVTLCSNLLPECCLLFFVTSYFWAQVSRLVNDAYLVFLKPA
jgi:hypothetical protein